MLSAWLVWCCRNQGTWRLVAGHQHALLTDEKYSNCLLINMPVPREHLLQLSFTAVPSILARTHQYRVARMPNQLRHGHRAWPMFQLKSGAAMAAPATPMLPPLYQNCCNLPGVYLPHFKKQLQAQYIIALFTVGGAVAMETKRLWLIFRVHRA